jgi:hypothetical protein
VGLSDDAQWDLAVAKFEEALTHYPAPAIEYNLASALYELGRLGEASDRVETVLADPTTPEQIREHAAALREQIGERAGTLTVRRSGPIEPTDRVLLDGRPLAAEALGTPRPVAPGTHVIALERDGQTVHQREVAVVRGRAATVDIGPPLEDRNPAGPALWEDWRFWAIVTGALVFTAVVTALVVGSGGSDNPTPSPGTRMPLTLQF